MPPIGFVVHPCNDNGCLRNHVCGMVHEFSGLCNYVRKPGIGHSTKSLLLAISAGTSPLKKPLMNRRGYPPARVSSLVQSRVVHCRNL